MEVIEAWVPLFLFAVLFGLSMDYHQVFLLSRIRERYSQTGDNTDAIAFGIGSTARTITGAALVIAVTLIRSVLVPAAMQLLGERNWYLPGWLRWLPRFGVEGPAQQAAGGVTPAPQPK